MALAHFSNAGDIIVFKVDLKISSVFESHIHALYIFTDTLQSCIKSIPDGKNIFFQTIACQVFIKTNKKKTNYNNNLHRKTLTPGRWFKG